MNPNVQELLNKARESLGAAELLYRENYYDFAASRAYYAMFYVAEAFLLQKELAFSSHSAVIAAFGREFAKTEIVDRKFHRYLIDAEQFRAVCDYATGERLEASTVTQTLIQVEEFLQVAEKFLANS